MTYSIFAVLCICLHFSNVYVTSRDYEFEKLKNPQESLTGNESISKRQRVKTENVVIKIFSYFDYSAYKKFLDIEKNNKQKAEDLILFYYAHINNGIRKLYKTINTEFYRYDVKTVKLTIAKTKDESITEFKGVKLRGNIISYDEALDAMITWAIKRQRDLPVYGVFVLFTTYSDMISNSPVLGLAAVSSACLTDSNTAVIKLNDLIQTTTTTAHEIGHNLGAEHDGDDNNCLPLKYSIMSPRDEIGDGIMYAKFSRCAVTYFKSFINSLSSSIKKNCLKQESKYPVEDSLSKYLSTQPGERITLDQQCQLLFGVKSKFCLSDEDEEDVCHSISCIENGNCYVFDGNGALNKSPCGRKKTCHNNKCVYDATAKQLADEPCKADDKLKINYEGKTVTCAEVAKKLNLCYHAIVKRSCCKTCYVKNKPDDCLYGNSDAKLLYRGLPITCGKMKDYPYLCKTKFKKDCCETCKKINK